MYFCCIYLTHLNSLSLKFLSGLKLVSGTKKKKVRDCWCKGSDGYRCRDKEQSTVLLNVRPGFVEFLSWASTTNTGIQHPLERKNQQHCGSTLRTRQDSRTVDSIRAVILTFRKWAVRWHGSKPEGEHAFLWCKTKKIKITQVTINWFKKINKQLTWCWFTCFIILLKCSVALPPSVVTPMNTGAGRASSTLWQDAAFRVSSSVLVYLGLLRWTCSMRLECTAGSVLTENLSLMNICQSPARTGSCARYFCLSHWKSGQSFPSHKQAPKQTINQMIAVGRPCHIMRPHPLTLNPYVVFGSAIKIIQLPATFFNWNKASRCPPQQLCGGHHEASVWLCVDDSGSNLPNPDTPPSP